MIKRVMGKGRVFMRGKRDNIGDILIDLTSLLDVIFIVLLVVLCSGQISSRQVAEEKIAMEKKEAEVDQKESLYRQQLDTAEELQQYVMIISVDASYDPSNIKERNIEVLISGNMEPDLFQLVGENTKEPLEQLEERLHTCIEENADKHIILSLNENDERILYRDETALLSIFEKLGNENKNVLLRTPMQME